MVVHTHDIGNFNTENCIPLDNIEIFHYSSSDPVKVINNSTFNQNIDLVSTEENIKEVNAFINDNDYLCNQNNFNFSNFTKKIIIYIAGFVVHKLSSIIQCQTCFQSLCSSYKELFCNFFIAIKNRGGNKSGLNYSSNDIMIVCLQTEKNLKSFSYQNKPINTLFLQCKVLHHFYNSNIFNSLKSHSLESISPLSNHIILLIKFISCTYIKLKINYNLKIQNENPSLQMWYNKLALLEVNS